MDGFMIFFITFIHLSENETKLHLDPVEMSYKFLIQFSTPEIPLPESQFLVAITHSDIYCIVLP